ncbi:hypothetical protein QBC46DRAFT_434436 [Diplogelasinospora grovesii]|uniref:Protein kinase domain-containing protein n=1 Tax=Diplogelasinospora grovesii TaxID=303347 RepID=A0AAN6N7E4_9PEZI|nr:hypothetical protein QBC46DRAFT_434436 [Diplogelasinospora grovesii]
MQGDDLGEESISASNDLLSRHQCAQGATLSLIVEGEGDNVPASTLQAKVVKLVEPQTMSVVMQVTLEMGSECGVNAILKLYDRRFAMQLRAEEEAGRWTISTETIYRKYVIQGKAEKLFRELNDRDEEEESANSDDDAEETLDSAMKTGRKEGYLQHCCKKLYRNEVRAYGMLGELQGKTIQGILIEYIDGFKLSEVQSRAPRCTWQAICEGAIRAVRLVGEHNILNRDIRPDNFIVRATPDEGAYEVFQIDFGFSELKNNNPWKRWRDDEESFGLVMEKLLRGGYKYTPLLTRCADSDKSPLVECTDDSSTSMN